MCSSNAIGRREFLAGSAALILLGTAGAARAQAPRLPLLPFNTGYSYWDHHWIMWIDHPVYEAIEVALAQPDPATAPLVRLWLTERAGDKRQVYYFNDAAVARTFAQESHFAEISVEHRCEPGFARDLTLAFVDKDGAPVRWEMRFPMPRRLSTDRAGLKPQNGHAARSVLLFWYVNLRAEAGEGRLTLNGNDYVVRAADRPNQGYLAAYNAGVDSAVISYGPAEIAPTPEGFGSSWAGGRTFQRQEGADGPLYAAQVRAFRQPGTIALRCDAAGALLSYRHAQGARAFSIDFEAPLLPAPGGSGTGFQFAVNGNRVASGRVSNVRDEAGAIQLRWEFADPPYARDLGLVTAITPHANGGYGMRVAPTH